MRIERWKIETYRYRVVYYFKTRFEYTSIKYCLRAFLRFTINISYRFFFFFAIPADWNARRRFFPLPATENVILYVIYPRGPRATCGCIIAAIGLCNNNNKELAENNTPGDLRAGEQLLFVRSLRVVRTSAAVCVRTTYYLPRGLSPLLLAAFSAPRKQFAKPF